MKPQELKMVASFSEMLSAILIGVAIVFAINPEQTLGLYYYRCINYALPLGLVGITLAVISYMIGHQPQGVTTLGGGKPEEVKPEGIAPVINYVFCTDCGGQNTYGGKYCNHCGKPLIYRSS